MLLSSLERISPLWAYYGGTRAAELMDGLTQTDA